MIDLQNEKGLSPSEAAATCWPSIHAGRPTHASRVVRAILKGTLLPDGTRVRLEALKLGGQWVTTGRCIREYGEKIAAAEIRAEDEAPKPRPTATRARAAGRADRELDKIGI